MGSPQVPTADQMRGLQQASGLETSGEHRERVGTHGELKLNDSLPRQGVVLYHVNW